MLWQSTSYAVTETEDFSVSKTASFRVLSHSCFEMTSTMVRQMHITLSVCVMMPGTRLSNPRFAYFEDSARQPLDKRSQNLLQVFHGC